MMLLSTAENRDHQIVAHESKNLKKNSWVFVSRAASSGPSMPQELLNLRPLFPSRTARVGPRRNHPSS